MSLSSMESLRWPNDALQDKSLVSDGTGQGDIHPGGISDYHRCRISPASSKDASDTVQQSVLGDAEAERQTRLLDRRLGLRKKYRERRNQNHNQISHTPPRLPSDERHSGHEALLHPC